MPRTKKTLLLCRHAKSSWKEDGLADHDRPLNKRGKQQAPRVGEWLKSVERAPDWIVTSSAKRARRTAEAVAEACGFSGEIQPTPALYQADLETLGGLLRRLPDEASVVLLVGHNPELEELLAQLTGEDETLSTATVAEVRLWLAHWKDFSPSTRGELVQIWTPPREPE